MKNDFLEIILGGLFIIAEYNISKISYNREELV